jgi:predicted AlkP superfamily phosphohydrolase/phosphomutase
MCRVAATSGILVTVLVAIGGGGSASAGGGKTATVPRGPKRVIVVSWDGAADWVIDKLLAEGKLPNVARLVASGVRTEASRPAWPSKTACGHAAIWTGAYSDVNGISGNWVPQLPKAQHTLLEDRSGFHSTGLTAEPLWISAARAGKKVVVLSATHTFPSDRDRRALAESGVPEDRLKTFSGFESKIARATVLTSADLRPAAVAEWKLAAAGAPGSREIVVDVAESRFFGLVFDDPNDPVKGLDTLLIRQGSRDPKAAITESTIRPREAAGDIESFSQRFRISKGSLFGFTYFRLFDLAPDGSRMTLYQRGVSGLQGLASAEEITAYTSAYGGFHDEAFFGLYDSKELGPRLWEGGDGTAERRVLELVRLDVEFRIRGIQYAARTWNPDLVFHYTPTTDSAGHLWIGALDPEGRRYDPALAEKLWPVYEEVFRLEDRWLGQLIDAAGPEGAVCLVSDHGMAATDAFFFPNAVLERAGLLAATGKTIDLARTRACVPPWSDFFVTVNGTERLGGVVKAADREAVLREVEEALLSARDPGTGRRIVRAVFRPAETVGLGIGGMACGDLYYDLMPGYYPFSRVSSQIVEPDESAIGSGNHGFFSFRRSMQAICIMGGVGLAAGRTIGPVRQIDIAPTLSYLLGIPPPRDARGHAIADVFQ